MVIREKRSVFFIRNFFINREKSKDEQCSQRFTDYLLFVKPSFDKV